MAELSSLAIMDVILMDMLLGSGDRTAVIKLDYDTFYTVLERKSISVPQVENYN